jgi:hypothetical protein
MVGVVERGGHAALVTAGIACAAGWALLGALFTELARSRCRKIIAAHEAALAEGDRRLAEEDAQRHS